MKILACSSSSGPRAGIMAGDGVVDAGTLLGLDEPVRDIQNLTRLAHPVVERVGERPGGAGTAAALPTMPASPSTPEP
jgi:hypothetical protein